MTGVPALELRQIVKRFGGVEALADASLRVAPGTVHALLGENGAGKTTLMRVAFGMIRPDSGTMHIHGTLAALTSPRDAIRRGVGMVHQHFTLVDAMTVAENVALGGSGTFHARRAADRVRTIGRETGLELDPDAVASSLPASAQQRLEIVKALAHGARTLILDEPTAVLAPAEVDDLLRFLRGFADSGGAVVVITHKLREAIGVADEITVLRAGRTVAVVPRATGTESGLAQAMFGSGDELMKEAVLSSTGAGSARMELGIAPRFEESADSDADSHRRIAGVIDALRGAPPRFQDNTQDGVPDHQSSAPIIARAQDLRITDERGVVTVRAVSLVIRAGEIVGIAGVEGAGHRDLLRALAGLTDADAGLLQLPAGIAFIPEHRHRDGLVLEMSLEENLALKGAGSSRAKPRGPGAAQTARAKLERFGIVASPSAAAATLSGGNQQKLVLARELTGEPSLIIAENATQGLDIAATSVVHALLRAAARRGAAVVFHSSDLDEMLAVCSRILVMFAGSLSEVSGDRATVGAAMLGAT